MPRFPSSAAALNRLLVVLVAISAALLVWRAGSLVDRLLQPRLRQVLVTDWPAGDDKSTIYVITEIEYAKEHDAQARKEREAMRLHRGLVETFMENEPKTEAPR